MENLGPNKIKIEKYKNICIYCIGYVTAINLSHIKINSVNPLYIIIDNINGTLKKVMKIDI